MTITSENENPPQQLINGELKPLVGMEATSNIPVIKSKAEYLKAVMYEGVRPLFLPPFHLPTHHTRYLLPSIYAKYISSQPSPPSPLDLTRPRSPSSKAQQPGARNAAPSRPKSPRW